MLQTAFSSHPRILLSDHLLLLRCLSTLFLRAEHALFRAITLRSPLTRHVVRYRTRWVPNGLPAVVVALIVLPTYRGYFLSFPPPVISGAKRDFRRLDWLFSIGQAR